MRGLWSAALLLLFTALTHHHDGVVEACGPGRGYGRRRGPRKLTPLVFKQHYPNVPENTLTASGLTEGRIGRNDTRFRDLIPNYNPDVFFKDEEGTGADRLMTQRCKEKLNTLAISVMNQWPGVRLLVTEGWDEEGYHTPDSLHYEGRAVDLTTSDRDRSKYGMLARLAVEAGFDWVYYESRAHIHCSVKSESSQSGRYGGCFSGTTTVITSAEGTRKNLSDVRVGDQILAWDSNQNRFVFSEVLLFLDYDPHEKREFLFIELESGRTLTVTQNHLVRTSVSDRWIFAKDLNVNDSVCVGSVSNAVAATERIVRIDGVHRTGVYAPLTTTGTIVANDVVASCYATIDSQRLAQWVFAPMRVAHRISQLSTTIWRYVQAPFLSRNNLRHQHQQHSASSDAAKPPTRGVHWYARMLYATAEWILPSHLYA